MAAEKDATLEQAARQLSNEWVKSGAAPDPAAPAPAPPPPAPTPAAPAAPEPAPAVVQVRGPDGRFGPKTPADQLPPGQAPVTPKLSAAAPPATPVAPAPGAGAAEVLDFIEAQLEGSVEPFKIPRGVRLPQKRGETIEYEPLDDILKRGMMGKDYIRKTQGVAERTRVLDEREAEMDALNARMAAREQYLQDQEKMLREANTSQEGYDAFQAHLRAMESNPRYKQMVEDAIAKRETDAENTVYRERERQDHTRRGVRQALGWIDELAADPKYAGVDKTRVRLIYGTVLKDGAEDAQLDRRDVEHIFEAEAQYLAQSLTPLQQQVAELTAKVEELSGQQTGVQRHNAQTAHAVQRGGAVPTKPVGGSPPAPAAPGPVAPFTLRDLPDRNREWSNRR